MTESYFYGETLDDLMRESIESILSQGVPISPTKGPARELTGVLLELSNPRSRLSRTETRGKAFSCLGELCWYLAKSNDLEFIKYYIPGYEKYADGNLLLGGYGPRLFDWDGVNQVSNIQKILARKPSSRQAVVQLFSFRDIIGQSKDVPCTCTLQFFIRNEKLHMFTSMRSNDSYLGFPHDVFSFTMIQEIVSRSLGVDLGPYKHAVGSFHLYEKDRESAVQFLDEGWQSTKKPMPAMPEGDPWPAVESLMKAECLIREGSCEPEEVLGLAGDDYWEDLIRLLLIFRCRKDKNLDCVELLKVGLSGVYHAFVDDKLKTRRRGARKNCAHDFDNFD